MQGSYTVQRAVEAEPLGQRLAPLGAPVGRIQRRYASAARRRAFDCGAAAMRTKGAQAAGRVLRVVRGGF